MTDDKKALQQMTDTCVKCGLCLPYCPTYVYARNENESPRGRIALIQAWANEQLPASPLLTTHIDSCLLCRACENVCPAQVPYAQLVDTFRAQTKGLVTKPLAVQLLNALTLPSFWQKTLKNIISYYQNSPWRGVIKSSRLAYLFGLGQLESLLPPKTIDNPPIILKENYASMGTSQGKVALFLGCLSDTFDKQTVQAAIHVLTQMGYDVSIPATQSCCGALALHDGNQAQANALTITNHQAFANYSEMTIITLASGCASTLCQSSDKVFNQRIDDISHFIIKQNLDCSNKLKPLNATVLVHQPCTLINGLKTPQSVVKLLKQIPDARIEILPEPQLCCGAAGSYSLYYPKLARQLVDRLLDSIDKTRIQYLVSSNLGCALHIRAALHQQGINIEVLHPITLLSRQFLNGCQINH